MSTSTLVSELVAIREEHGTLTPALLVELARDPGHPLHSRFEWDDRVAGEKWRLEQAGHLLRVTERPDPTKPNELRAFMAVRGEDTPTSEYVPTGEAFADPFTANLLLRQMKRDAASFHRRWKDHVAYAAVVQNMLGEVSA